MNNIRFITSFTVGSIYERFANELLIPSFEQFNLPYHLFAKPDLGEWKINSRQRPLIIKEAMELFPNESIVWIDADAKVLKYPELLFRIPDVCQLGIYYLQSSDRIRLLDGTSYFKNCPEIKDFVSEWIDRAVICELNHCTVMQEMINERIVENLNLFILPLEYCHLVSGYYKDVFKTDLGNVVISHLQASAHKGQSFQFD